MGLPRTTGWGFPEPYIRDLMFSILGIAVSENKKLLDSIRKVLETLSKNQTDHGHIHFLVYNSEDRGASDTTPLFLLGVGIFNKVTGESKFLHEAVEKALTWMKYQSPSDRYLVAQQPNCGWCDEQWVLGYGLFVNTIVYSYLRLLELNGGADDVRWEMSKFTFTSRYGHHRVHEGLVVKHNPYYTFWSYKILSSERSICSEIVLQYYQVLHPLHEPMKCLTG